MNAVACPFASKALEQVETVCIEEIDVADTEPFSSDAIDAYFARLRREGPIRYCAINSLYGPYWSVTRYKDIVEVKAKPLIFSSETKGITIEDNTLSLGTPMFISMDPPEHDAQRLAVSPSVAPENLTKMDTRCASAPARCWMACRSTRSSTESTAFRSN